MYFMICKYPGKLQVFWGPDGWQGISALACKYLTEKDAQKALKFLDLKPPDLVFIESRETD